MRKPIAEYSFLTFGISILWNGEDDDFSREFFGLIIPSYPYSSLLRLMMANLSQEKMVSSFLSESNCSYIINIGE